MAITIVALNNTFDEWRTRTNQLITQSNYYETNLPNYPYANNIGVTANAFASATIAGANIAVGDGANNFTKATLAGANTAVGDGANNFTKATMNGANTAARDAANLTTGTVPSARMSGSYTGITGVGTLTAGTWNASIVGLLYGGTGSSLNASQGGVVYGTSAGMSITGAGVTGQVLVSDGTGAPTWSNALPVTQIPNAANLNTYTTPGQYHQSSDSQATAGTNYPVALSGLLEVHASSLMVYQRYTVYNSGRIYTRSSYNGSWYPWLANLDSVSFNSYAPTLTGTGAGGTWSINITGNAGYATTAGSATTADSATTATTATTATNVSGGSVNATTGTFSGAITSAGDITAFSSDARLKGDIQTITNALSKVKLITGITYKHNDLAKSFGYTDENRFAGVLAQEVEDVLPEVVVPAPFDVADDGTSKSGENYKTVKYDKIVSLLIEAIKELSTQVESMKLEIEELKK